MGNLGKKSQSQIYTTDFEMGVEGKRKAAFVILYAKDGRPWENYREADDQLRSLVVPMCLMLNRGDGKIGFVGGKDDGEGLRETVRREVQEEIGHDLQWELEPVVAHDIGPITTHAFSAGTSFEMLKHIQKDAALAADMGSEVTGVFLAPLIDYAETTNGARKGGIVELLQNNMAISVREELVHFCLNEGIFTKAELTAICSRAELDLDELLK